MVPEIESLLRIRANSIEPALGSSPLLSASLQLPFSFSLPLKINKLKERTKDPTELTLPLSYCKDGRNLLCRKKETYLTIFLS